MCELRWVQCMYVIRSTHEGRTYTNIDMLKKLQFKSDKSQGCGSALIKC
jgi:hypothetical protein